MVVVKEGYSLMGEGTKQVLDQENEQILEAIIFIDPSVEFSRSGSSA